MASDEIRLERSDPAAVFVELHGKHDAYTAEEIRNVFYALLAEHASIVVDLSGTEFIDSTVIGALLGGRQAARECGVGFAVLLGETADSEVRRALEVTGLMTVFWIATTREGAVDAVQRSAQPV